MTSVLGRLTVAATVSVAVTLTGSANAAGDPYVPDAAAGWCPGGRYAVPAGGEACRGEPFGDGTFYQQRSQFVQSVGSTGWSTPRCSRIDPGSPKLTVVAADGCEGRGLYVRW